MAAVMSEAQVDHLIYYGVNRTGTAVEWLTQWPVTAEAAGVLTPGEPDTLFVQYFNHVPLARRLAEQAEVVWGGDSSIACVIADLERRAARPGRVGIMGPLTFEQYEMLSARFGTLVNLNRAYLKLRTIKSAEEIDWLRLGAAFSDAGMAALESALQPGLSERALGDAIERAYVAAGGTTVIHYIGATPMHDPKVEVPAQFPSSRRVEPGDVVVADSLSGIISLILRHLNATGTVHARVSRRASCFGFRLCDPGTETALLRITSIPSPQIEMGSGEPGTDTVLLSRLPIHPRGDGNAKAMPLSA